MGALSRMYQEHWLGDGKKYHLLGHDMEENVLAGTNPDGIDGEKKKKLNVLVVDDEEGARDTLSFVLKSKEYYVETAATGKSAIVKAASTYFDVFIIDIRMPGINGVETMKILKMSNPSSRYIVVTGYGVENLRKEAIQNGAVLLEKPLNMDIILGLCEESKKSNKNHH